MGKLKGGRRKGVPFENEVCRILSEWWSWGESLDWFRRTEASGGRATARAKSDDPLLKWEYGDITFRHEKAKPLIERVLIETKRGHTNKMSLLHFIDNPNVKQLWMRLWWEKACKECKEANRRFPIVIFKRDKCRHCMMISDLMVSAIEPFSKTWPGSYIMYISGEDIKKDFMVVDFYKFLQHFSPEDIISGILI